MTTTAPAKPRTKRVLRTSIQANFTADPGDRPIVASGKVVPIGSYRYPVEPPREWFARTEFGQPQPVEVTPEGQVRGHVACWGVPHIGYGGKRVYAPKSRSKYSHFLTGEVLCEDGSRVKTGPVYIDCDHADLELNAHQAKDFMAHTGSAVADVAVFEDKHGIQIVGALRPDARPAQVRAFRGSDVSPDWRPMSGRHEMVGLVVVNTSGLITPGLVAGGTRIVQPRKVADGSVRIRWDHAIDEPAAMVAVGMMRRRETDPLDEVRGQVAALQATVAELRAERIVAGLQASPTLSRIEAQVQSKADGIMARIGA